MEALKIEQIAYDGPGGGATIHPADTRYPPFRVTSEYVGKHQPRAGGYWVSYDGGAYFSFSPAKPFEEGYTLIPTERPTIKELEKILLSEPDAPVHIHPDGTVTWDTAAQQPMPPQGSAAQNLYPAQPEGETTVSDPDTHA